MCANNNAFSLLSSVSQFRWFYISVHRQVIFGNAKPSAFEKDWVYVRCSYGFSWCLFPSHHTHDNAENFTALHESSQVNKSTLKICAQTHAHTQNIHSVWNSSFHRARTWICDYDSFLFFNSTHHLILISMRTRKEKWRIGNVCSDCWVSEIFVHFFAITYPQNVNWRWCRILWKWWTLIVCFKLFKSHSHTRNFNVEIISRISVFFGSLHVLYFSNFSLFFLPVSLI